MERITSRTNEQVKQAVRLCASTRHRRESGLFLLEGMRLCTDALGSGYEPELCFFTSQALAKWEKELAPLLAASRKSYEISEPVCAALSDTQSPQGVFAVWKILDKQAFRYKIEQDGYYIALENVQDPGNLGAICRTAEALGLNGLLLGGGCDLYHPKAQRAAMGSLLRLPVFPAEDLPDTLRTLRGQGFLTLASVPDAQAKPVPSISFRNGTVCVIGNEGNGVSSQAADACEHLVTIPMAGRAESLNAAMAAAILMWEMVRP